MTRAPFGAQFQLVSHVSGCKVSCPQASECDLRSWAAGRFVVSRRTATAFRLCPRETVVAQRLWHQREHEGDINDDVGGFNDGLFSQDNEYRSVRREAMIIV